MKINSNIKGVRSVLSLLEVLIQCVTFLGVTVAINLGVLRRPDSMWYSALYILIPVVLSYLIRKYVDNFFMFLLSNVAFIAFGVIAAGSSEERLINAAVMVLFSIFSTKLKDNSIKRTDMDNFVLRDGVGEEKAKEEALKTMLQGEHIHIAFVAVMVVGYFIGSNVGSKLIMNIEVVLCILFIILQVIYNNMEQIFQVYSLNNGKTEFPAQQLKVVNTFVTAIAVIIIFFGMLLFYSGEYGSIIEILGRTGMLIVKFLLNCLLAFIRLLSKEAGMDGILEETKEQTTETIETEEVIEGSPFLNAAAEAFAVGLIACIVIGFVYYIKTYVRNFNKTRKQGRDVIEYINPAETKEKLSKTDKVRKVPVSRDVKSVRKLYKQKILYHTEGYAPDLTSTPTQLTIENITKDKAAADEITAIYEKARYSNEEITKTEMDIMKKLS